MPCIEHDFSKVARIEAYALSATPFTTPVYVCSLTSQSSSIPSGSPAGKFPIKFTRDSAKCQDKSSRSVAGIVHQVTVTWDCQPITEEDYAVLTTLQNTPHEIIITYFGMQQKVIRTDEYGYSFDFQDDNGTMKCSMTLTNGQGLTSIL